MSDTPISRFEPPRLDDLPADIAERIAAVQEKSGFVSWSPETGQVAKRETRP